MTTADDMVIILESIDVDLSAQIAMEETASDATLFLQQQLFKGLDGNEVEITPSYSSVTVKRKQKNNQPFDRVTLRDTGDFYKGILLDVRGDTFVLESADYKSEKLQKRYGEQILLLGNQAQIQWLDTLRISFFNRVKSYFK